MASSDDPSAQMPKLNGFPPSEAPLGHPSSTESAMDFWQELSARARTYPHRIALLEAGAALSVTGRQFTYAWLLARCRKISHLLTDGGDLRGELRVGTLLGRSPHLVASLLAILRSGATYVPLDPAQPPERLRRLIEDADLQILLVDHRQEAVLDDLLGPTEADAFRPRVIRLREEGWDSFQPSPQSVMTPQLPERAAYILYTSGSTGVPKGVVISRGALAGHCQSAIRRYGLGAEEKTLVFANPAFDVSIEQILPPLACGATLVLAPQQLWAPEDLRRLLGPLRLTSVNLPPAYWRQMLASEQPHDAAPALRRLLVGGEALYPADTKAWRCSVLSRAVLFNAYGPTEAAITATAHKIPPGSGDDTTAVVPIGRHLDQRSVLVTDRALQPVTGEDEGELCLGGPLLARGYLGRPATTAEQFVPDPAARHAGQRLYKTGDLVRRQEDGRLVFLRRIDQQMKVHGVRIEPGEIEAALHGLPEIRQAVVVKVQNPSRLAAFVVPTLAGPERAEFSAHRLRQHLARRLPTTMIPTTFVERTSVPLNTAGKVDRAQLAREVPPPKAQTPEIFGLSTGSRPPQNDLEATLVEICRGVLGLPGLGVEDHLFEVGSDSILNLRIAAKAQRAGLQVTSKDLFQHPTVAGLAALPHLRRLATVRGAEDPTPGFVPLTPIVRWFFTENDLPERQHFNQAILLAVERPLPFAVLHQALLLLLTHHDALRLRFDLGQGGWQQRQCPTDSSVPLLELDLSALPKERQTSTMEGAAAQLQASLDLARPPLLRAGFFRLAEVDRLLLIIHHLAVDAVSWAVLLADLEMACRRFVIGQRPRLPAKTTAFKIWAKLLADHARSPATAEELSHWCSLPAEPPLPLDKPAQDLNSHGMASQAGSAQHLVAANTRASLREVEWRLDEEETHRLIHHLPTTFRARVDEVLLTALLLAWQGWTGRRAMRVDLEGHGREDLIPGVDLSRTVGWFTTIFPVHLEAPHEEDLLGVLQAVGQQLRAVPWHGIGYGMLRYLSGSPREAELPSSAAVNFNYLGQLDRLWYGNKASAERFFGPAEGPTGPWRATSGRRVYPLEIEAAVRSGKLTVRFRYSRHLHRRSTIERLADDCCSELRGLIERGAFDVTKVSSQPHHRHDRPSEVEDIHPTTPLQQGMLFHSLYAPTSTLYCEQSSWTITGALDLAAFWRAWRRLLVRHPILRTAFSQGDSEFALALVHRRVELPLSMLDWQHLPTARRKARLAALLRQERLRGFDLARPPLLRLLLVHLQEKSWRFVWTKHHSLLDGWSISCLFEEFFALYEAFATHGLPSSRGSRPAPDLPDPPPFRDYIAWLGAQALDTLFWRRHLGGLGAPTPPPGAELARGGAETEPLLRQKRLSHSQSTALQAFARQHHLTLNTVVQGAWALELGRAVATTGASEVIFGATLTHRPESLPGADRMVGLLLNTLPVRVRITAQDHLLPWLQALQEQNLELRQRGHTSLPAARQAAGLPGDHPLFETLLAFQNYPGAARLRERRGSLEFGDLLYFNHSHYPLTLQVTPGEELLVQARFDRHRLNGPAVSRMLQRWLARLSWIAHCGKDLPLADIPWLTRQERHQMLVEWNDHPLTCTPPSFPQLLARRVEGAPEAIALVGERTSGQTLALSYGELAERSAGLGEELRARGVGPESRVGLCLKRSPEQIVTILAVLHAGGAWLPLDPAYPPQRLAWMVEDARLTLLVTQPPRATGLEFPDDLPTFALPSPLPRTPDKPWAAVHPMQMAYLIYTSGSTGRPKGAQLHHGGLAALAKARPLETRSDDAVLQFASASFDASVFETVLCFAVGATLHLASAADLRPGQPLEGLLMRRRITQAVLPPSSLAALPTGAEERLPALRTVLVAGEACPVELARCWRRGRSLIDAYGPTETTVCATAGHWSEGSSESRPPIGRPLLGTTTYLFDHHLLPVALGVPGELCIGGAGVGRGYWRQPALTAERFVPDAMALSPGGRLYRSGDRVSHLNDGRLDFLGRFDHQMKIRGFRIEPGEVEDALCRHPAVAKAVVGLLPNANPLPRDSDVGHEQLVAWLVPAGDSIQRSFEKEIELAIRPSLGELLPAHMVPTAFVLLERLPLTPNGKVDRSALRRFQPRARTGGSGGPPRDVFEQAVAECWRHVLGLENPGLGDNFFELGGHSLLATQVLTRLHQSLGFSPQLRDLFDHPLLEDLATRLRQLSEKASEAVSEPVLDAFEELTL